VTLTMSLSAARLSFSSRDLLFAS